MDTKIVYNVDPITRAYIGPQECYKTALDADTWQWTGLVMEIEPPTTAPNEIAVALPDFSGWEIKTINQIPAETKPPKTIFTSLEFLDKFTESEQLAVVEATMTTAAVKLWYDRLLAASFVDLEDSRIPDGLNALVSAGILDASRVAEIMTPEVQY